MMSKSPQLGFGAHGGAARVVVTASPKERIALNETIFVGGFQRELGGGR